MFKYWKYTCLTTIIFLTIGTSTKAQVNSFFTSQDSLTEIKFIPPEDGEKPETQGAGTRNPQEQKCSPDDSAITAIMPNNNYGLTTQERPKIFLYLPQTTAKQVVLSFQDRSQEYHEVAFLEIASNSTDSNIISLALPENKPPLKTDNYYQWKLTLVCGEIPNVNDPILTGWVKRISVDEQITQLSQKSTIEQAKWYALNGYWYDLLEQIEIAENDTHQKDFESDLWQQLIEQY